MAKQSERERIDIGRRRLVNILTTHGVAPARTLEQKISDAGPNPQRVDPHVLTKARRELEREGRVIQAPVTERGWYQLHDADPDKVKRRLEELYDLHTQTTGQDIGVRIGQALEIAVYKSLCRQSRLTFLGGFPDLDDHDDSTRYRKEEPPLTINGRTLSRNARVDFLLIDEQPVGPVGVEVKNTRPWIYPDSDEVRDLLRKCCEIDAVPVLIARRIQYATFRVLGKCGLVIHQTFNQLYPTSEADLAEQVRNKHLLGYHDVRVGNEPDQRLNRFLHENLPDVLSGARASFDAFKDLLKPYAIGEMEYHEFAARARRRQEGRPEDFDYRDDVPF